MNCGPALTAVSVCSPDTNSLVRLGNRSRLSFGRLVYMPHARTSSICSETNGIEPIPDDLLDNRSDEAIVEELKSFRKVTSEKNIWAFWYTGWDTMKPWTQRNIINWAHRNPGWTIRILDRVEDSPSNIDRYLEESYFPSCFKDRKMEGPYAPAHSADLVRLPCIYEYGGVWLDVSILLFRSLDDICWNVLQEDNPYQMAGFVLPDVHREHQHRHGYMENWFIAAKKGNPWIQRWHAIFTAYWCDEGRVESKDVMDHELFKHLNFKGYRPDMIDYLAQHVSFQRLRLLEDPEDGFSGPDYFCNHMFLLDCREEGYYLPDKTAWQGQVAFDLMSAPYDSKYGLDKAQLDLVSEQIKKSAKRKKAAQPNGSGYRVGKYCDGTVTPEENNVMARHTVLHMISQTCLTKSVHGFKGDTQLSDLWNAKENADKDREEGTCADFLRWASTHVRQTRSLTPLSIAPVQDELILREPLLGNMRVETAAHDYISQKLNGYGRISKVCH